MRVDSKLAFVQATIEYLLSKLEAMHTFSLIVFNHEVCVLAELFPCTPANKETILRLIHGLNASGPTNISEALFAGARILAGRGQGHGRVSTLMLFTDGLSNQGLSYEETLNSLEKMRLPPGCIFNTFGFGSDHDSKLLHRIAQKAQGVYYFVEKREDIPSTFGECLAALLNTAAHELRVTLRCHDGARLVTLATPFAITERQTAKEYDVQLELMYRGESKTIIFRLSLRKFDAPTNAHSLMSVEVDYTNTITGRREKVSCAPLTVMRPAMALLERVPLSLDSHLNRYTAATSIVEAIELRRNYQYDQAVNKLLEAIDKIGRSTSCDETFCQDLQSDLRDCIHNMADPQLFESKGIHLMHAYASMYFMERSAGTAIRSRAGILRHNGYGYVTAEQASEARQAADHASKYISAYISHTDSLEGLEELSVF